VDDDGGAFVPAQRAWRSSAVVDGGQGDLGDADEGIGVGEVLGAGDGLDRRLHQRAAFGVQPCRLPPL